MKNLFNTTLALSALAVLSSVAYAKPAPKTMVCPYCKMKMGMKKTKAAPVAIKLKMGTYYCCTTCHPAPKTK